MPARGSVSLCELGRSRNPQVVHLRCERQAVELAGDLTVTRAHWQSPDRFSNPVFNAPRAKNAERSQILLCRKLLTPNHFRLYRSATFTANEPNVGRGRREDEAQVGVSSRRCPQARDDVRDGRGVSAVMACLPPSRQLGFRSCVRDRNGPGSCFSCHGRISIIAITRVLSARAQSSGIAKIEVDVNPSGR
jgi:hypothetical protein